MAATLQEILLAPDTKPAVTADCLTLVDQEVADKSGVSGVALKGAYKVVRSFAAGYLTSTLEALLPEMLPRLQPYWDEHRAAGGSGFGDYLSKRGEEVAESLLYLTDSMAADSEKAVVVRAYKTVRGSAAKNIEAALPRVGALVEKYAG